MKRSFAFLGGFIIVLAVLALAGEALAKGPTDAIEVQVGAQNSGAPSQQLAGRLGLLFDHLDETVGKTYLGTVETPMKLAVIGCSGIKAGQKVELTKIGELQYRVKFAGSGQEKIVKVKFAE